MSVPENWASVPTRSIEIADTQLAYRRLGPDDGTPIVLLNHWGANLDGFDPHLMDGLATDRPVLAFDYRGIGRSGGDVPTTIAATTDGVIAAIRALTTGPVDIVGFSMGGFVTQQILLDAPEIVRRVVIAGTGPAGGAGIERVGAVSLPLILRGTLLFRNPKIDLFFTSSANSRNAGKAFLARLKTRTGDLDTIVGPRAFLRQLEAIHAWGRQPAQPLETVRKPTLVVNGDHDVMVPSENSRELARRIPGAELVLYRDAGHGGIFQYHEEFLRNARAFLNA